MVTVVNTPPKEDSGNAIGLLVILVIILAIGAALFYYGLPMLNRGTQPAAPQINVPEQIDVNVNQQPNQ